MKKLLKIFKVIIIIKNNYLQKSKKKEQGLQLLNQMRKTKEQTYWIQ